MGYRNRTQRNEEVTGTLELSPEDFDALEVGDTLETDDNGDLEVTSIETELAIAVDGDGNECHPCRPNP